MAIEFNKQDFTTAKQILAFPDHYVNVAHTFTATDDAALITTTPEGKKIIPAGTIYPSNDADAYGVVFYDIDVTNGDRVGAIVLHGFIKTSALPAAPAAAAMTAMPMIRFMPVNP